MRICYVTPWFPSSKGTTAESQQGIFIYRQAIELARRGNVIKVVSVRWPDEPAHENAGENIEVFRVPRIFTFPRIRYPVPDLFKLNNRIREICREGQVDLIEFVTQVYLTTLPIFSLKKLRIPVIVSVFGIPGTSWFYGSKTVDTIGGIYQKLVGNRVLKLADGIATENSSLRSYLAKIGVDADRVYAVTKGVDTGLFKPGAADDSLKSGLGIRDNEIVVLYVGRLDTVKGVPYLLQAAKTILSNHDNVKFLMVGDGSLRQKYESSARGLSPNIIFTGWRQDIPRLMNIADMFVLPSLSEGAANVVMESSASGLPIIASRVGEVPQIVSDGETGILTEPKDVNGLVHGMEMLINDLAMAKKMGQAGRKRMEERYGWGIIYNKLEEAYRETIDRSLSTRSA